MRKIQAVGSDFVPRVVAAFLLLTLKERSIHNYRQ
jgi:hypothetical protein